MSHNIHPPTQGQMEDALLDNLIPARPAKRRQIHHPSFEPPRLPSFDDQDVAGPSNYHLYHPNLQQSFNYQPNISPEQPEEYNSITEQRSDGNFLQGQAGNSIIPQRRRHEEDGNDIPSERRLSHQGQSVNNPTTQQRATTLQELLGDYIDLPFGEGRFQSGSHGNNSTAPASASERRQGNQGQLGGDATAPEGPSVQNSTTLAPAPAPTPERRQGDQGQSVNNPTTRQRAVTLQELLGDHIDLPFGEGGFQSGSLGNSSTAPASAPAPASERRQGQLESDATAPVRPFVHNSTALAPAPAPTSERRQGYQGLLGGTAPAPASASAPEQRQGYHGQSVNDPTTRQRAVTLQELLGDYIDYLPYGERISQLGSLGNSSTAPAPAHAPEQHQGYQVQLGGGNITPERPSVHNSTAQQRPITYQRLPGGYLSVPQHREESSLLGSLGSNSAAPERRQGLQGRVGGGASVHNSPVAYRGSLGDSANTQRNQRKGISAVPESHRHDQASVLTFPPYFPVNTRSFDRLHDGTTLFPLPPPPPPPPPAPPPPVLAPPPLAPNYFLDFYQPLPPPAEWFQRLPDDMPNFTGGPSNRRPGSVPEVIDLTGESPPSSEHGQESRAPQPSIPPWESSQPSVRPRVSMAPPPPTLPSGSRAPPVVINLEDDGDVQIIRQQPTSARPITRQPSVPARPIMRRSSASAMSMPQSSESAGPVMRQSSASARPIMPQSSASARPITRQPSVPPRPEMQQSSASARPIMPQPSSSAWPIMPQSSSSAWPIMQQPSVPARPIIPQRPAMPILMPAYDRPVPPVRAGPSNTAPREQPPIFGLPTYVPQFQVPTLNHSRRADGFQQRARDATPDAATIRNSEYKEPPPPKPGFTSTPDDTTSLICADCDHELGTESDDMLDTSFVWFGKCGHVYCGICAFKYHVPRAPGQRVRTKTIRCAIPNCGVNLATKNGMTMIRGL